jgi:hypothetical protein
VYHLSVSIPLAYKAFYLSFVHNKTVSFVDIVLPLLYKPLLYCLHIEKDERTIYVDIAYQIVKSKLKYRVSWKMDYRSVHGALSPGEKRLCSKDSSITSCSKFRNNQDFWSVLKPPIYLF